MPDTLNVAADLMLEDLELSLLTKRTYRHGVARPSCASSTFSGRTS